MALKEYRIKVYTRKGIPIHVATFDIKATSESDAGKKARRKIARENPDKPKRYFFIDIIPLAPDNKIRLIGGRPNSALGGW